MQPPTQAILPYFQGLFKARYSLSEWVLLGSCLAALALSAVDTQLSDHIGDSDAIHMAKLQAQESLLAQTP